MANTRPSPTHITASNVRELRTERGWTLEQLSEQLQAQGHPLRVSVLSRIERAERRIDVDDVVALAAALGVPVHWLVRTRDEDVRDRAHTQAVMWSVSSRKLQELQREVDTYAEQVDRAVDNLQEIAQSDRPTVEDVIREVEPEGTLAAAVFGEDT